jgi:hypothetical protein
MGYAKDYMSAALDKLRAYAIQGRWENIGANNIAAIIDDNDVYIQLSYEIENHYEIMLELHMDYDQAKDEKRIYYHDTLAFYTANDTVGNHLDKISKFIFETSDKELREQGIACYDPEIRGYVTNEEKAVEQFAKFLDVMIPIIFQVDFYMKEELEPTDYEISLKEEMEESLGFDLDIISPLEEFNQKVRESKFNKYPLSDTKFKFTPFI